MSKIFVNEDNEHYYANHLPEDMSVEALQRHVDYYAATGAVQGLLFCVNMQRALFDSKVWERFRDIDADYPYITNLRLLSAKGIDQFTVWLDQAEKRGLEPWLTMRMNDSHGLKEAALGMLDCKHNQWPSQKWRERIDLRRAPYRLERSWEGSYNYLLAEVREHHLALVKEILERYNPYAGLELDWVRWGMLFPPGFERVGQKTLTEFVLQVRELADSAEKKYGHRIKLAHKLPANPESCLNCGFDVISWGKNNCVDMVTLSGFCGNTGHDQAIDIWRCMTPADTVINVVTETITSPYPSPVQPVICDEVLYGAAASAYACGADHVYLFNENYRETDNRERFVQVMQNLSCQEKLQHQPRIFPVTYNPLIIPGESNRATLPVNLRQDGMGWDLGRMEDNITLRLSAGEILPQSKCYLRLGFSADTSEQAADDLEVRVNTTVVKLTAAPDSSLFPTPARKFYQTYPFFPKNVAFISTYAVPLEILHSTWNAIEILASGENGQIVWADFIVV